MPKKKHTSQAEKAVSAAKGRKNTKTKTVKAAEKENPIPLRLITSGIFLALFILFLVIFLKPEGALTKLIENILVGLFGRVGFVISIPV